MNSKEVLDAYHKHGSVRSAARELGMPATTFSSKLVKARKALGLPKQSEPEDAFIAELDKQAGKGWVEILCEGIPNDKAFLDVLKLDPEEWHVTKIIPRVGSHEGFMKGGSKSNPEPVKVTMKNMRVRAIVERRFSKPITDAIRVLSERSKPLPKPKRLSKKSHPSAEGSLCVFGLYDAHIGALAWDGESDQNEDVNISHDRCLRAIDDLSRKVSAHNISKMIVPIGNDFMHFDNEEGMTTSGRVTTDFDSRYGKVVVKCHDVLAHMTDRCLELCDDVELIYVGGNHDRLASLHFTHWLKQRYRNDNRVTCDTDMHPRKYRTWNATLLGFAHGDRLNLKDVYRLMAEEARESWATAKCREMHVGDKHHTKHVDLRTVETEGKVTVRQNPSLAPRTRWTIRMGYEAVRAADVWLYDKYGFDGMYTTYAEKK